MAGLIGVIFIFTAAVVVRPLGVLLLSLLTTAGQLAGSLVADLVAPTPGTDVGWQLVARRRAHAGGGVPRGLPAAAARTHRRAASRVTGLAARAAQRRSARRTPRQPRSWLASSRRSSRSTRWPTRRRGFVWRLQDEAGDATALRPWGDDVIVNLSVWASVEALRAYVYGRRTRAVLRQRRAWFVPVRLRLVVALVGPGTGTSPTLEEAKDRLDMLAAARPEPAWRSPCGARTRHRPDRPFRKRGPATGVRRHGRIRRRDRDDPGRQGHRGDDQGRAGGARRRSRPSTA